MVIIDANIVLRYLLEDSRELSLKAADIIENQTVTLPMEAACEVVYVLQKVYSLDRPQIQKCLSELVSEQLITVKKSDIFLKALKCYATTTFDSVDTLLWAYSIVEHHEVITFDKKLDKLIKRTYLEEEEIEQSE